MLKRVVLIVAMVAGVGEAGARPPPPPEESEVEKRPVVEWATWVRVAYGVGPEEPEARARVVVGEEPEGGMNGWEVGGGAEVTLPVGRRGDVRVGAWGEVRTSSDAVVGGQLMVGGKKLDLFWYEGERVWVVRAGGNRSVRTAQLGYGYRAPWKLWGPWRGTSRYMIGVRIVGTVTQDLDDRARWSATVGLETEPVGALRYLLGIRDWY